MLSQKILPTLGDVPLKDITTLTIRQSYTTVLAPDRSEAECGGRLGRLGRVVNRVALGSSPLGTPSCGC